MKTKVLSIPFILLLIACAGLLSGCAGGQFPTIPNMGVPSSANVPASVPVTDASVNGKYTRLIQKLHCPADASSYGQFSDYGYWGGGRWCGKKGAAGYWVWVNPTWYVWKNQVK